MKRFYGLDSTTETRALISRISALMSVNSLEWFSCFKECSPSVLRMDRSSNLTMLISSVFLLTKGSKASNLEVFLTRVKLRVFFARAYKVRLLSG